MQALCTRRPHLPPGYRSRWQRSGNRLPLSSSQVRPRACTALARPADASTRRLVRTRNPFWAVGEREILRTSRYILAVTLALGLTACSTEAAPTRTANAIVSAIVAKVATAKPGVVYTADTDPNHLLGQPNGYTSKATFTDSRINPADIPDAEPGNIQAGGSVEVFADASSATIRQQHINQLEKNAPLLGTEYTFTDGPALLRVSGKLTPAQAGQYQAALNS